jgi:hypothetical protein
LAATEEKKSKWKPGAWTPERCRVWKLLDGERRTKFEAWVNAERDFCYPEHVTAEFLSE